ncbi:hypothetical protein V8E54_013511 [Elaphomyces granulatus]
MDAENREGLLSENESLAEAELPLHTVKDPTELPGLEQDDQTAFTVKITPNTDLEELRDSLPTEKVVCSHSISLVSVTAAASNGAPLSPFSPDDLLDSELAFNPVAVTDSGLLLHAATEKSTPGIVDDGIKTATEKIANEVAHPKRAIIRHYRSKTARRLSRIARPYSTSSGADRKLLAAHDSFVKAQFEQAQRPTKRENNIKTSHRPKIVKKSKKPSWINEEDKISEIDEKDSPETPSRKIEELEPLRAIAWITRRHVKRVRRVPSRIVDYPSFGDDRFLEKDGSGSVIRFKWERYIGQLLLYFSQPFTARYVDGSVGEAQFDPATLSCYIERLIMATEPWQSWFMNLRRLYCWEEPRQTASWFAIFAVLWYTQYVVAFLYAYIIAIVVKNRYFPSTVKSFRYSFNRALGRSTRAYRWGELIDRHGREQWLELLLNEVGPYIQVQMGDLAAFLEILGNFYNWQYPRRTAATLFFLVSCLSLALFTDLKFCMKVFWFVCINTFFLGWPVASRYPQYRFLVSPVRWVFWDIPTHTEWAIASLQQHEARQKVELAGHRANQNTLTLSKHDLTDTKETSHATHETQQRNPNDHEFMNGGVQVGKELETASQEAHCFRANRHGCPGYLLISLHGLRFIKTDAFIRGPKEDLDHELWSYEFSSLLQLSKSRASMSSKMKMDPTFELLEFEFLASPAAINTGGEGLVLVGHRKEGTASNTILQHPTTLEVLDLPGGKRDEVFNLIIGIGRLRWSVLGLCPETA